MSASPTLKTRWKLWLLGTVMLALAWLGTRYTFTFFNDIIDRPERPAQAASEVAPTGLLPYVDDDASPPVPTKSTAPVAYTPRAVTFPKKPRQSDVKLAREYLLFHTVGGDILFALYPEVAPATVKQFLKLARLGVFDNTHFSRLEPGFVIQTSVAQDRLVPLTPEQKQAIHPLPGEFSKTLKHTRGLISMGRDDGKPDSAETSFSIMLGNAPHLDGQYTIFGHVEAGLDVVARLEEMPRAEGANFPATRLTILSAHVISQDELASFDLEPPVPAPQIEQNSMPQRAVAATATRILQQHCWKCHGGESTKAGLDLTTLKSFLEGGEHGPVFTAKEIDASPMLKRLTATGEERMPPKGPGLHAFEMEILTDWLRKGATFPPDYALRQQTKPPTDYSPVIAKHWAFQPLKPVTVPEVKQKDWVRNPIDAFILAKLEAKQLSPAPPASASKLQRRLSYTMTGLPPEVGFAKLDYSKNVERLLSSKHFGEQMARQWLDVVRFAESDGYEDDKNRPTAYQYRDFIIRAFNDDMPFHQFVHWQIAGDEISPTQADAMAATGFLASGPFQTFFTSRKDRFDELDDIVSTTSVAMLGMTVGCARCHDHKHDPISQHDYYRMVSVFHGSHRSEQYLDTGMAASYLKQRKPVDKLILELEQLSAPAREQVRNKKIDAIPDLHDHQRAILRQPYQPDNAEQIGLLHRFDHLIQVSMDEARHYSDGDVAVKWDTLQERIKELEDRLPPAPTKGLIYTGSQLRPAPFLDRGDSDRPRGEVPPAFLTALTAGQPTWQRDTWKAWGTTPRAALAHWMTDTDSGAGHLVARVIVNRLWQHHFGTGLVKSVNDFGVSSTPPTHPELLDWLAQELIRGGWKLKPIHRLIVTSNTYQVSAHASPELVKGDPENLLWGRRQLQRLNAEGIRDSILATSGQLNREMFGPSIKPAIPIEAIFQTAPKHGEVWPAEVTEHEAVWRRSLYIYAKRSNPVPFLQLFDAPDAAVSCACRAQSTTPTQALALLNDNFIRTQAMFAAKQAIKQAPGDLAAMVQHLYRQLLGREVTTIELQRVLAFLTNKDRKSLATSMEQAITDVAQTLFMTNEFLYVE